MIAIQNILIKSICLACQTPIIAECIEGFVTRKKSRKKNLSFHDWVLENFGSGIAKHFFFPFQSKIFDYDIQKVAATWMGRFVPSTSLEQMLEGALNDKDVTEQKVGYNAQFFIQKKAVINSWINTFADTLANPIFTEHAVKEIDLTTNTLTFENGECEQFETLINTMPLDIFLKKLKTPAATNFGNAHTKLVCNSVINFNLGFSRPDVSDKHWIYYPESEFPFYRIGFPHNFAPSMVPAGCSSMYGEMSYIKRSEQYLQEKLKRARAVTKRYLKFKIMILQLKRKLISAMRMLFMISGAKKTYQITQKIRGS